MEHTTYVGLDVHRETVVATALTEQGEKISQVTLGSSREELIRFLHDLPGQEKQVVLEACAMWEMYFDTVESSGATAILSNPLKTRMIAEATISRPTVSIRPPLPLCYAWMPFLQPMHHLRKSDACVTWYATDCSIEGRWPR